MRLKLKEDPKEWRNFALICCAMLLILSGLANWRGVISGTPVALAAAALSVIAVLAIAKPRIFRPFYRLSMAISFQVGQALGKVILGTIYILVITPLGLAL